MKRVLLAGVLGAIAMFFWSFLAHVVLPLGEVGVREMPNESAVLSSMNATLGQTAGLYIFPGPGLTPEATREQREAAMKNYNAKLATNPSGILIYHGPGVKAMEAKQLWTEFLKQLAMALIVAFMLSRTRLASYVSRLLFVTLAGVMAGIATNVSYWNWYGFPTDYTLNYIFMEVVGFFCMGLVAAAIIKTSEPAGRSATA